MARLTVKQLSADLEALRVERQALLTQVESLRSQLAAQATHAAPRPAPTAALSAYREALAKARALAMSSGRSVRVGK